METILFILSATAVIHFVIKCVSVIAGNSINLPVPFLHIFNIGYENVYIATPAVMHQVYFWASYTGVCM
jgi:hypothetical protein